MNTAELKATLKKEIAKAQSEIVILDKDAKREAHETHLAGEIFIKIIESENVTEDQIEFLKSQSFDIAKAILIIGLQVVPGSSLAIIALEKIC